MATTLTPPMIAAVKPYWYARLPFTATVALAPGTQAAVLGPIANWNPNPSPDMLVLLNTVRTARDPNLILTVQADRSTHDLYTIGHPPGFAPVTVDAPAVQSLSLTARNPNTATSVPSPVLADVTVFRLPVTYKVLLGYPLTPTDEAAARALGLDTAAVAQNGTYPIPLSTMIERTYLNRQYATPLVYDGPPVTFTANSLTAVLPTLTVPTNALYILRAIHVPIDPDYQPLVTVNWETTSGFWQFDPSVTTAPITCFLPTLQQVQVVVTVQSPPPGPVPIRIEAWRLTLSNLLRVRLGLVDSAGLAALYQSLVTEQAQAQGQAPAPAALAQATQNAGLFVAKAQAGVM